MTKKIEGTLTESIDDITTAVIKEQQDGTVSHAKPKARKTPAAKKAPAKQTELPIAPAAAPTELVMMPVELIECAVQVRTEFNDDSLAELASDIAARGVLQPILLRPIADGRYEVIAGERRLRACRLANLPNIPAIVGQIDDATVEDMQLAENIQREDLSLKDTATAIRKIYDKCESVTETAAKVRKSKSWVSKHLMATSENLHWEIRNLFENGVTEDLEIIITLQKLFNEDWAIFRDVFEKVKAGEAGRQSVRNALEELPARQAARLAEVEESNKKHAEDRKRKNAEWQAQQKKHEEKEEAAIAADPHRTLWRFEKEFEAIDSKGVEGLLDEMTPANYARLKHHLEQLHTSGIGAAYTILLKMHLDGEHTVTEMAAFMSGMAGEEFELEQVLRTTEGVMKEQDE